MGPQAGVALCKLIIEQTLAAADKDHLPLILSSIPSEIPDRSEYIAGVVKQNPGEVIAAHIAKLESLGAKIIGLACNTAHSDVIFKVIKQQLMHQQSGTEIIHMIDATGHFIKQHYAEVHKVGLLGTKGTYASGLYARLGTFGLKVVLPDLQQQNEIHQAIYDTQTGIKGDAGPSDFQLSKIEGVMDHLGKKQAELILLGCTELPLVYVKPSYNHIPIINPSMALARAMINKHSPEKLRPWRVRDKCQAT